MLAVSPSTAAVASSPKLLDRVRWHLRVKHYSVRTEQAYVDWIRRYILFHHKRHPNEMGEKEITRFLTHLAVEKSVAASDSSILNAPRPENRRSTHTPDQQTELLPAKHRVFQN